MNNSPLDAVLAHVDAEQPAAIERLFELLRIDSISTDPGHARACVRAADWLVQDLASMGFAAERCDTSGHPMVMARQSGQSPAHLLFYGHYDVQPVDPLAQWRRAPFDPAIEQTGDGPVIRARGAADDKGQLMTFLEGCRSYRAVTGHLPVGLTIFFEGEEESGSPSLVPFLKAHRNALAADLALVCDTGMWDANTPAITTMLRGMVTEQLIVHGPSKDLHSGMYGGVARNPIHVLTRILAELHDEQGRVCLPGFYDGVHPLPDAVRAQWQSLQHDEAAFLGDVGLSVPAGEPGYSVLEQIWSRPTCEINGVIGGYTGEGFKTVLPAEASAKVSFRLVGQQDPLQVSAAFRAHVEQRLPTDCSVEILPGHGDPATVMPVQAAQFEKARAALSEEWPRPAVYAGCGGSIPVVGHFRKLLGLDSLLVGFGLDDDAIHSPNEKYSVRCFHKGTRSWVRILHALAEG